MIELNEKELKNVEGGFWSVVGTTLAILATVSYVVDNWEKFKEGYEAGYIAGYERK